MKLAFPKPKDKKGTKKKSAKKKEKEAKDLAAKARIHERDGYRCVVDINISTGEPEVCNRQPLQSCHILPKGKYQNMRHVDKNLLSMCFFHHLIWQHKDPLGFADWFHKKYPGLRDELLAMDRGGVGDQ